MIIEIDEIKRLIPHRPPFLFIDKCQIFELGKNGSGFRLFSEDEFLETLRSSDPELPGPDVTLEVRGLDWPGLANRKEEFANRG